MDTYVRLATIIVRNMEESVEFYSAEDLKKECNLTIQIEISIYD